MTEPSGPEEPTSQEHKGQRPFALKRVLPLIKYISLLAVVFYLVYFVAASIVYRNEQNVLLSFVYRIGSTASAVAGALVVYAIATIVEQYKKE